MSEKIPQKLHSHFFDNTEKIELAKRIHDETLVPRGLRVMPTGSQGIKSYAYWVQGGQGAGYRVPVGG